MTKKPKQKTVRAMYVVDIIESERGWGQSLDSTKRFSSLTEANKFVKEFNAENNKPTVPDWYMRATEPRLVEVLP